MESTQDGQAAGGAGQGVVQNSEIGRGVPSEQGGEVILNEEFIDVRVNEGVMPIQKPEKVVVRWEGVEYVAREKNTWWYVGLAGVTVVLVLLSVLLRWWTFTAVVVLAAVALVLYTVRPPRKIKYVLSNRGLKEGERLYAYGDYKSFGVEMEDGHYAVVLMPRKRFSPRVRVYFPQEVGEAVVDAFGARLPMEEVTDDFLDKIVKWLRI